MHGPFLALITPLGLPSEPPSSPPGIWNPVFPTNPIPIYPGGSPNPPGGGQPPSIWNPVFPTNPIPIYPGGSPNPPTIWGPNDPRPGYWVPGAPGAPGYQPPQPGQPPSIWNPVFPTNPIPIYPGGSPNPPGIWGPNDPRPTVPIAWPPGWVGGVPPGGWPENPTEPPFTLKPIWTPENGWTVIVLPKPDTEVPTPSK